MQRSKAPMEWLADLVLDVTSQDLMADLDPGFLAWDPGSRVSG